MTITAVGWLFTAGVLAHNAEEALFLPDWSRHAGRWHPPVGACEFRWAACVFSGLAVGCAAAAGGVGAYLMAGVALAMALNAVAPHALVTVFSGRYMPGTGTALAFNLPLGGLYLSRALAEGRVEWQVFRWAGPLVVAGLLALIPALFSLGRWLCRSRS